MPCNMVVVIKDNILFLLSPSPKLGGANEKVCIMTWWAAEASFRGYYSSTSYRASGIRCAVDSLFADKVLAQTGNMKCTAVMMSKFTCPVAK